MTFDRKLVERVLEEAQYMIDNNATVRQTAEISTVRRSSVHKDLAERLPYIDRKRYKKVRSILDKNKEERHIRGGMATRAKYLSGQITYKRNKNS